MASIQKNITFSTVLLQAKKTATGIQIPNEVMEQLNGGKKPAVKVTINNFTYRSTVAVMGGVFMVGVSADNRMGANIKGGDKIVVNIQLDTEERIVEVPVELQQFLDKNKLAKGYFDSLSNSRKKILTLPIFSAKTAITKLKNIEKAKMMLLNEKV
jgi:hypothetical protein